MEYETKLQQLREDYKHSTGSNRKVIEARARALLNAIAKRDDRDKKAATAKTPPPVQYKEEELHNIFS